ncbi:MAG: diguanylate cyclase (GGDEF)-like protein [Granulosicoccus sp.]|jgi:diguanylate cyclase (GGDEF)-like protein
MSIKITIIDNNPCDQEWLACCLKVMGIPTNVSLFVSVEELKRFYPDVILISESMLESFLDQHKKTDYHLQLDIPFILLLDWGKADVDTEYSEVVDVLPKSFVSPHLLSSTIRYAVKNARHQRELKQLAHYDNLTNAANRHLFLDRLSQALLNAKRGDNQYGLVSIDLDEFKPVNDTHGHDAGDYLLKMFVKRVKKSIRESDTIARIGGDEFAILLPSMRTPAELETIVNKIFHSLKQPIIWQDTSLQIKASAGLSLLPISNGRATCKAVMKAVDSALLEAKRSNKGSYKWFS